MEYGGLKITPKAGDVFSRKVTVSGRLEEEEIKTVKKKQLENIPGHDEKLFQKLRSKRKELADSSGMPPYIIFSDRTLIEMSAYFPQSAAGLRDIYGVGEEKLKKHGFAFLEVIREYCEKHSITEKPKTNISVKRRNSKQPRTLRHVAVGEAYNAGETIPGIMAGYSIKLETVLDHLFGFFLEGNEIRTDGLLNLSATTEEQRSAVFKTFDQLGPEYLGLVFRAHSEEVSYEDLKILRLYYLNKTPK